MAAAVILSHLVEMPRNIWELNYFENFWNRVEPARKSEKILNVITLGLGGPQRSTNLEEFLPYVCNNYDRIYVFAFGKIEGDVSSVDVLKDIEKIPQCADKINCYYYNGNLPAIIEEIGSFFPKEVKKSTMELQQEGQTLSYYRTHPYIFYDSEGNVEPKEKVREKLKEAVKVTQHINKFLNVFPNGTVLIDNNAFIRHNGGQYLSNLNFEFLYWIPLILSKNENVDRIHILESAFKMVPFLSPEAIFKATPEQLFKFLMFEVRFPSDDYNKSVRAAINAAPSLEIRRNILILIYKCLESGSTELPDFASNACVSGSAAAAGGSAAAAAPAPGTMGGRRQTRKSKSKRSASKRQRRHRTRK